MYTVNNVTFRRGMDPNSLDIEFDGTPVGHVQCYPGEQPRIVLWGDQVNLTQIPVAVMKQIVEKGEEMHQKRLDKAQ